jgi:hypothetical protein
MGYRNRGIRVKVRKNSLEASEKKERGGVNRARINHDAALTALYFNFTRLSFANVGALNPAGLGNRRSRGGAAGHKCWGQSFKTLSSRAHAASTEKFVISRPAIISLSLPMEIQKD